MAVLCVQPCRQAGEGPCLRAVKLRRVQRPQPAAKLAALCKRVRRRIRRRALPQCCARSCMQAHACVACGAILHPRHIWYGALAPHNLPAKCMGQRHARLCSATITDAHTLLQLLTAHTWR